ncbi:MULTISPECIES: ABC transporter permease [Rhodococcus]|uniref:ABC transporter permease n=1 Tax=Rhodococcus rhodochrous TaxID=1829 RepID=A0AAW4XEW0_RHORH|nr:MULTISPECIES: ABC transporter permease [Rhodococcus]KLL97178.1 ABC transporter transmembrane protein [Rhodococcus sp. IITR03]MCD2111968.1 ABC transporter permease [Rhodococcus rhodochrous]QHG84481.1 ABC transporter permease [Rhodococcus rhodochrous]QOH55782.1 ABC transporter permease [Rhodococcus rhodochrous]WAL47820.1 ABC transporter permease [Rhodococcus pyridinivorans]
MTVLLTAEFRKVLSLRYWWILGIAPLLVGLFCGALTLPVARQLELGFGDGFAEAVAAAVGISLSLSLVFLFAAIFGAVATGSEFAHRTIVTTFLTARGRDRVVGVKFATVAVIGLLYCIVTEVAAAATLMLFGGGFDGADLGSVAKVMGIGLFCALMWSLIGAGLGLLTRSTTGSVLAICAWVPFGELMVSVVLHGLGLGAIASYLPAQVTWYVLFSAVSMPEDVTLEMTWPAAPLLLILWTVVLGGLGWWRARTADVV